MIRPLIGTLFEPFSKKMLPSKFFFARFLGISIWSNVQPFKHPNPEIIAKMAIMLLALSPSTKPIASAYGALDNTISLGLIIPIIAMLDNTYIKNVRLVPIIVAFGIVLFGFLILSAGIVADSIPRNAKNVSAVVIVRASKFVFSDILIGVKFEWLKTKNPIIIVASNGIILINVVMNWNCPTFFIPNAFIIPTKIIINTAKGKLNKGSFKFFIKIVV